MELKQAIKLNEESETSLRKHGFGIYADAVKTGNEAIARLQRLRSDKHCSPTKKLPGED